MRVLRHHDVAHDDEVIPDADSFEGTFESGSRRC
jgi:hypothetical protein